MFEMAREVVVAFPTTIFANDEVEDALIPFVKFKYVVVAFDGKR